MPGQTIAQKMGDSERPRYISLDEAYQWMVDVAEGLSYLHLQTPHISHGDIKPDNLIISPDGIKLMDFGHSRTIEDQFVITNGMGSWLYSAPEILGKSFDEPGKRYISSDIYAYGVVFYRILTGCFPRNTLSEIIASVPFPQPCDLNSAIPRELNRIIVKCLEKDPEDRFLNADELLKDLKVARDAQQTLTNKELKDNKIKEAQGELKDAYKYIDLAQQLSAKEDYIGAINALDNAISRISTNATILFMYAHLAKKVERFEVAKRVYLQLIKWMEDEGASDDKKFEACEGLGEVLIKLKDYDKAVRYFAYLNDHSKDHWYAYRYGVVLGDVVAATLVVLLIYRFYAVV